MQPSHRAAFCFPAAFCLFLKTTCFRKLRGHFAFPGDTLQEQFSAVTAASALLCARVDNGGATRRWPNPRNSSRLRLLPKLHLFLTVLSVFLPKSLIL